jgi:hypothetical protein
MLQIVKLEVLCFFADFFDLIKTYCIFICTKYDHTLGAIPLLKKIPLNILANEREKKQNNENNHKI